MASVNDEPGNRKEHGRWQTHGDGMRPIDRVLARLPGWTQNGKGYSARCPAHDDKTPSLTISEVEDGKVLLHCFPGCKPEAIVTAIGLTLADLFPAKGKPPRIVATYDYHDEQGTLLYQSVRYDPKNFKQRRPDGHGGWIWKMQGVRLVLYNLPAVVAAETIFIVEGEKDVETLRAWGLVATCNPMGAGKWRAEYSQPLKGKHVVVLRDNDKPGEEHAHDVTRSLFPVVASGKGVRLSGLPDKGDVSDWRNAGHTKEELLALVEAAPLWTEEQHDTGFSSTGTPVDDWPEPLALPTALLPVLPFPDALLPGPLSPWLSDIAERMQCPLDFPAIGAVVTLASIVGRRVGIYPKRQDDWLVIPNLWGAVIGRPGILKTPALSEVLKPLKRLEIAARERYDVEMRAWEATKLIRKLSREETEKKMRTALREGKDVQGMAETLLKEEAEPGPVLRRYMVNDTTVEKLGVILNENPTGTLVFRDELTGWLYTLEKEGHENDRSFYLEAWNGDGAYTYDRIGRGTIFIPAACVSLLGGIQPSRLAEYLRATIQGGDGDDGLMQRFQLAVYPDSPAAWRNVDRWPDSVAKTRAHTLFTDLDALTSAQLSITPQDGERVPGVRFDSKAQGFFDEWRTTLETKLRGGQLHPALESHLSKYRSLMPSLALLFFLLDYAIGTTTGNAVPVKPAHLAAAWCDFLEIHAYRIYSGVTEHALFSARLLAERIPQGALPNPFTLGAVLRKNWSGLGTLEDVRDAAELLEESYWIRAEKGSPGEKGGRPRFHYWINPHVLPQKDATE